MTAYENRHFTTIAEFHNECMTSPYIYIQMWRNLNGNTLIDINYGVHDTEQIMVLGLHLFSDYEAIYYSRLPLKEIQPPKPPSRDLFYEYRDGINGVITE